MRAAILHAPHDLRIEPCAPPPLGDDEVLVRIRAGGICGSDLHYYQHGGFGTVRMTAPMVLGHEVAGIVAAVGGQVRGIAPGDHVAVDPSRPCGACRFCAEGLINQCLDMRFYGSAMRTPHIQGAFREALVCTAAQAVVVPRDVPLAEAAFAEPLAVCLHALAQAGPIAGRRVLVTGLGPIGQLAVLAARQAGAAEIVAVDLLAAPVALAARVGADRAHDLGTDPGALEGYAADKGRFDLAFEVSGSAAALNNALAATRPGGTIVQIGLGGPMQIAAGALVAKEVTIRGSFRFRTEFADAARLIATRAIDVRPVLSHVLPLDEAVQAFELAGDRRRAMKVQLAFD